MRMISESLNQTKGIAEKLVEKLEKDSSQATVICLEGQLGAGKTTFVKFVADSLLIKKQITSPTFVILKSYKMKNSDFKNFIHVDAYRLESSKEIIKLGWKEILNDPYNLIFLEWPENVSDAIPKKAVIIELKTIGKYKRSINIKWPLKKKIKKS